MNILRRQEAKPAVPAPAATAEWSPWSLMRAMLEGDPFREMAPFFQRTGREMMYMPDFDVKETADAYVFKADVPGLAEKDVEVQLTGNRLTISGKREEEKKEEKETYYTVERSYGSFSRSFTLPAGVDAEKASADLKDGVLTVSVPKKPEVQPKKIAVGNGGTAEKKG